MSSTTFVVRYLAPGSIEYYIRRTIQNQFLFPTPKTHFGNEVKLAMLWRPAMHTWDKTMLESTKAVFNTTELLENIVAYMTPIDLLRARAVCRSFKTTIDTSRFLQQKLFLQPVPLDILPTGGKVLINPFKTNYSASPNPASLIWDMYLTQPPATGATALVWDYGECLVTEVANEEGIRLRDTQCVQLYGDGREASVQRVGYPYYFKAKERRAIWGWREILGPGKENLVWEEYDDEA